MLAPNICVSPVHSLLHATNLAATILRRLPFIFQKTMQPSTEHSPICLTCYKPTNSAATELWLLTCYGDTAAKLHCFNKTSRNAVSGSDSWQNTLQVTDSTVIRSERDCKCKNPLCTVTEVLSLFHQGTNASVSWPITLKIKHTSVK